MTLSEAAKRLGIPRTTLRHYIEKGILPATKRAIKRGINPYYPKVCMEEGCIVRPNRRGYCEKHYRFRLRHGQLDYAPHAYIGGSRSKTRWVIDPSDLPAFLERLKEFPESWHTPPEGYVTVAQAARLIHYDVTRVQQLIWEGKLPAEKRSLTGNHRAIWIISIQHLRERYGLRDDSPGPNGNGKHCQLPERDRHLAVRNKNGTH